MQNPWLGLTQDSPYVLPMDRIAIDAFNRDASQIHQVHFDVFPEPYLGNPRAGVVLLALNPGYCEEDRLAQSRPQVAERFWKCLRHEPQDYPFYYLDPLLKGIPGGQWWRSHLRSLLDQFGDSVVARNLLCLQVFPYASEKYAFPRPIPSLEYTLDLLREAIGRNALIVIMRHQRAWRRVAPELDAYEARSGRVFALKSAQAVHISPRNCPDAYPFLTSVLASG